MHPAERRRRRPVTIDLALQADLSAAGATDDLTRTVDYSEVRRQVAAAVRASRCRLVERLAQIVADTCLAFPGVAGVAVTLHKPGAVRGARSVGVRIERRRT
jgi:dihydroneopterin aldolase